MSKKMAYILDTGAILTGYILQLPSPQFTTPLVVEEVRDSKSQDVLEIAISVGKLKVKRPSNESLIKVRKVSEKTAEAFSLSETDISVLALAYDVVREGYDAVIFTDDYALQNTASMLGIKFQPIRTLGIKRFRRYFLYCPACRYSIEYKPNLRLCPKCGHKLVKKSRKSESRFS